ncbi:galectin-related protein-like isoform X1 [Phycodurus eques]|uniref:galectin-related protein-like isoform X1 n=1 Tax=Phycodurus eques TaxID=693459 RepID=UPI002ACD2053|nr:galectin-related protein-like isoform X1 [Phycodurus eques]
MAAEQSVTTRERKKWKIDGDEAKASISNNSKQDTRTNLAVPFRGHITGGLHPGRKVVIVGVVDSHPDKFYVALTCGRCTRDGEPPPDVALEMCVCFGGGQHQVLRRACVAGAWSRADSAVPFFPFIPGQPFKMEVQCELGRFRVFVDGQKLFDFQHRVAPLHLVDTLWIKGSIAITKLG